MHYHLNTGARNQGQNSGNKSYFLALGHQTKGPKHRQQIVLLGTGACPNNGNKSYFLALGHQNERPKQRQHIVRLSICHKSMKSNFLVRGCHAFFSHGGVCQDLTWVVEVGSSNRTCNVMPEKSPCLTRCRQNGHFLLPQNRMMALEEMEELQGFPAQHMRIPGGVTLRQYSAMIGDAFSVPVAGRVAVALLKIVGKLPQNWPDVWADQAPKIVFDFSRFHSRTRHVGDDDAD